MSRESIVDKGGGKNPRIAWVKSDKKTTWIESGVWYKVVLNIDGCSGYINDNYCIKLTGCAHLNGGDWEVSYTEPVKLSYTEPVKSFTPTFKKGDILRCIDIADIILAPLKLGGLYTATSDSYQHLDGYEEVDIVLGTTTGWSVRRFELVKSTELPAGVVRPYKILYPEDFPSYAWEELPEMKHLFIKQQEESKMSNTNRRVVSVKLIDNDPGLDVSDSLVYDFETITTEDDQQTTIQQLIADHNMSLIIDEHNAVRAATDDLDILKRTGAVAKLRPIKLKNLTWSYTVL